jgi:hypothetical protein
MRKGDGMRILFWGLISGAWALGSVNGTVTNATTGKPQPGVIIMLVQPGQNGMQTLANVKSDAEGKFSIDKDYPPGPALLQAIYSGATYNTMLAPGTPTTGVAVKVFDSTKDAALGRAAQHMILLEPAANGVQVSETFLFDNKTRLTFADPSKGSAQFYVPPNSTGKPRVMINSPGGMPIPRDAEKTAAANVFKISYPVKPGETRFDVSYTLPAGSAFDGKVLDAAMPTFLVTPPSVTLAGDGIDNLGEEPQTKAHTYRVTAPAAFKVTMEGTGSLRNAESPAAQEEDNGQPKIEVASARVYTKANWVLGLTFAILALGGVMLFRKGAA